MLDMEKKMTGFRVDERLKDMLGVFCDTHGFKQERALEAMVYALVIKQTPKAGDVFKLIQEMAEWEVNQPASTQTQPGSSAAAGGGPRPERVRKALLASRKAHEEKSQRPAPPKAAG